MTTVELICSVIGLVIAAVPVAFSIMDRRNKKDEPPITLAPPVFMVVPMRETDDLPGVRWR